MRIKILLLFLVAPILLNGCVSNENINDNKLPRITLGQVDKVYIFNKNTGKYDSLVNKDLIEAIVNSYNDSVISEGQSFETTPDNKIKLILKNGDEYLLMDGDGPQARVKLPNDIDKIVTGTLGPVIEDIRIQ
jgi:hypothetical protein